jgi:alkylation response protein AidB-like acyl-CoA dehydrogenase
MDPAKTLASGALRLLAHVGASELAARWHLRQPLERLVQRGTAESLRAVAKVQKAFAARDATRLDRPPAGGLFDLTLSEEQELVRDTMRRFAEDVLRPAAAATEAACAPSTAVFDGAADLGLSALAVPDSLGGAADVRSPVTGVLIAEELARGDVGLALALLAPWGVAHALAEAGEGAQQDRWLRRFGERFAPAALALAEPRPAADPFRPETGAVRDGAGWKLYGQKVLVPLASTAELFLVAAEVRGGGPRLFMIGRDSPGVTITRTPAMGLRSADLGTLVLDGAEVEPDGQIGDEAAFTAAVVRARLGWSALAVGGCQAVLDHVIPYCNDRVAFGEPITNRQSVAFMIGDIAIETDALRLCVWRAAALAERGSERAAAAVALARRQAAAKASKIGSDGVQLLGGHGYIAEHPVERWYRDLRAIGIAEGGLSV